MGKLGPSLQNLQSLKLDPPYKIFRGKNETIFTKSLDGKMVYTVFTKYLEGKMGPSFEILQWFNWGPLYKIFRG